MIVLENGVSVQCPSGVLGHGSLRKQFLVKSRNFEISCVRVARLQNETEKEIYRLTLREPPPSP